MELQEILTLWTVGSIIVLFLWCLMMGDAGTSKTSDIIVTIICAILGFPIFALVLLLSLTPLLFIKKEKS